MNRKKMICCCVIGVSILSICLILLFRGRGKDLESSMADFTRETSSESGWNKVTTDQVILENNNYTFTLNCKTAHFTLLDRQTGTCWNSTVADGDKPLAKEQASEVIISYFDSKSTQAAMNSWENSVEKDSFEIQSNGSGVRVYYSIRKSNKRIFVPTVLSAETFENQILSKIGSGPKRRLKGFYTLYESQANDSATKEMKGKYPALKKENLYILNDTAGAHNYGEITGYMDEAGYTQANYEKEAKRLELDVEGAENMPAAFTVPVEYQLTEDGFEASILTDRIVAEAENYQLTNISLLPYFAGGQDKDGWFLVPDGSGAIVEFQEKQGATYSQKVWGTDSAIELSHTSVLTQPVGLPVFGYHTGKSAVLAEIKGGSGAAAVLAEVYGKEIAWNRIYTDFQVQAYDLSNAGGQQRQAKFNIYSGAYLSEFPRVRYTLYHSPETTYSDMAKTCQKHMVEEGTLVKQEKTDSHLPLYVDFTGYETVQESFMGIARKNKIVFSTVQDIDGAVQELRKRGVETLNVRLKAYSSGGLYGSVSNEFSLDKCVGHEKELEELAKEIKETGGQLYLENNFSSVYETGSAFKSMQHGVRGLKKTVLRGFDYDLVSRREENAIRYYYMTSPIYFAGFAEKFAKEIGTSYGMSWSDYGSKLWSDFNKEHPFDRAQTVKAMENAMGKAKGHMQGIMTDGNYAYALKHAEVFLNMPLSDSGLNCESYSVPFYQMVIRGYANYAGAPMNTGADIEKNYLASVECGANPYYSFYAGEGREISKTAMGTLVYPTAVWQSYEDVEHRYQEFSELFDSLQGCTILEHKRVAPDVFVTIYEDGTSIAVNYNEYQTMVDRVEVPARGYAVLEKGGQP